MGLGAVPRGDRLTTLPPLHHTDETEARDKNFAGLLPLWDILFGTYYMPRQQLPTSFGTATPVPTGLVGQIIFPFRPSDIDKRAA